MKIVINAGYGGFSLSPKAVARLAELQGKPCFFFINDLKNGLNSRVSASEEQCAEAFVWNAYTVPNPDVVAKSPDNWAEMTQDEKAASNASWAAITLNNRPDDRANPLLIQVVEELGALADGAHAKLKIVEIPDGTDWEISEYDGWEHVAEKHHKWG